MELVGIREDVDVGRRGRDIWDGIRMGAETTLFKPATSFVGRIGFLHDSRVLLHVLKV